ncbi:phospholipid scramblase 1 [Quaeritorhiza haematococci]|nr:phospholipid scramblase 1 [Quaeritorhiza haematococci]
MREPATNFAEVPSTPPQSQKSGFNAAGNGTHHFWSETETAAYVDWINRELKDDADLKEVLPISKKGTALFEACRDGLLLCKLVNNSQSGTIDEKGLHRKPKSPIHMHENLQKALAGVKAIGVQVHNIGPEDIKNAVPHLCLGVVWQIIKIGLLSKVAPIPPSSSNQDIAGTFGSDPPSARLSRAAVQKQPAGNSNEKALLAWMNKCLKKAECPRQANNFGNDLSDGVCLAYLVSFLTPENVDPKMDLQGILAESNILARCERVLEGAERMGCRQFTSPEDIVNGSKNLNMAFVAVLYNARASALEAEVHAKNLKAQLQNAAGEMERLAAEKAGAEQEFLKAKMDSESLITTLKNQLDAANQAKIAADREVANLKSQVSSLTSQMGDLAQKERQCGEDKTSLRTEIQSLKDELAGQKQQTERVSAEKASLSKELDAAKRRADELASLQDREGNLKTMLESGEQRLEAMEGELSKLRASAEKEKAEKSALIVELNAEKTKAQNDEDRFNAKIRQLEEAFNQLNKSMEELKNKLEQRDKDNADLSAQLELAIRTSESKKAALEKELQDEKTKSAAAQDRFQSQLKAFEDQLSQIGSNSNQLKDLVDQKTQEIANLNAQLDQAKKRNAEVSAALNAGDAKLKESLENQEKRISELEAALEDASRNLQDAQASAERQRDQFATELNNEKTQRENAQAALASAERKLAAERQAKDEHAQQEQKLKALLANTQQRLSSAQDQSDSLQAQLSAEKEKTEQQSKQHQEDYTRLKDQLSQFGKRADEATAQLASLKEENERASEEKSNLMRLLDAARKKATEEVAKSSQEVSRLKEQLVAAEARATQAEQEIERLMQQLTDFRKRLEEAEQQLVDGNNNLEAARRQVETLAADIKLKETAIQTLNDQVSAERSNASALESDIAALKKQLQSLKEETRANALKQQESLAEKDSTIRQLQDQVDSLQREQFQNKQANESAVDEERAKLLEHLVLVEKRATQAIDDLAASRAKELELQQRIAEKENELEAMNDRIHEVERKLGDLGASNKGLQDKLSASEQIVAKLSENDQANLKKLQDLTREKDAALRKQQEAITQKEDEIRVLERKLEVAQRIANEANSTSAQRSAALDEDRVRLEQELANAEQKVRGLNDEATRAKKDKERLMQSLNEIQAELDRMKEDHLNEVRKIQATLAEKDRLVKSLQENVQRLERLDRARIRATETAAAESLENARLREQLSNMKPGDSLSAAQLEAILTALEALEEQRRRLSERLQELEKQHQSSNINEALDEAERRLTAMTNELAALQSERQRLLKSMSDTQDDVKRINRQHQDELQKAQKEAADRAQTVKQLEEKLKRLEQLGDKTRGQGAASGSQELHVSHAVPPASTPNASDTQRVRQELNSLKPGASLSADQIRAIQSALTALEQQRDQSARRLSELEKLVKILESKLKRYEQLDKARIHAIEVAAAESQENQRLREQLNSLKPGKNLSPEEIESMQAAFAAAQKERDFLVTRRNELEQLIKILDEQQAALDQERAEFQEKAAAEGRQLRKQLSTLTPGASISAEQLKAMESALSTLEEQRKILESRLRELEEANTQRLADSQTKVQEQQQLVEQRLGSLEETAKSKLDTVQKELSKFQNESSQKDQIIKSLEDKLKRLEQLERQRAQAVELAAAESQENQKLREQMKALKPGSALTADQIRGIESAVAALEDQRSASLRRLKEAEKTMRTLEDKLKSFESLDKARVQAIETAAAESHENHKLREEIKSLKPGAALTKEQIESMTSALAVLERGRKQLESRLNEIEQTSQQQITQSRVKLQEQQQQMAQQLQSLEETAKTKLESLRKDLAKAQAANAERDETIKGLKARLEVSDRLEVARRVVTETLANETQDKMKIQQQLEATERAALDSATEIVTLRDTIAALESELQTHQKDMESIDSIKSENNILREKAKIVERLDMAKRAAIETAASESVERIRLQVKLESAEKKIEQYAAQVQMLNSKLALTRSTETASVPHSKQASRDNLKKSEAELRTSKASREMSVKRK